MKGEKMSYNRHNFQSLEKLYAEQMNEMDEQIYNNSNDISSIIKDSYVVTIDHYDSSRVDNQKMINPTTGSSSVSSVAIGHCLTRALNGSLYPFEALYCDLPGYQFRAYGYKANLISSVNYIGCSDIIKCTPDNVFVRPNDYNYVFVEFFRDPVDSVALTPEEIALIASKINLCGTKTDVIKSELTELINEKTQIIPAPENYKYSYGGVYSDSTG